MSDLIERQAVLKICRRYWHPTFNPIMEEVEKLSSAQQEPTTWLGSYCPYTCQHCGKHTDSKTPFCAWCGRRVRNYD